MIATAQAILDRISLPTPRVEMDYRNQGNQRARRNINRLVERARRLVRISFSQEAIDYDSGDKLQDRQEKRRELVGTIDKLELEHNSVSERVRELRSQLNTMKQSQEKAAAKEIEDSFLSLRAIQAPPERTEWDVFLSYPTQDRETVTAVFKGLEGTCRVFMDWFCLLPGQNWQRLLPDIQRNCRYTIALISRHSQRAHFHISEIQRAINLMREGVHKILPVYLDEAAIAPFDFEQDT